MLYLCKPQTIIVVIIIITANIREGQIIQNLSFFSSLQAMSSIRLFILWECLASFFIFQQFKMTRSANPCDRNDFYTLHKLIVVWIIPSICLIHPMSLLYFKYFGKLFLFYLFTGGKLVYYLTYHYWKLEAFILLSSY